MKRKLGRPIDPGKDKAILSAARNLLFREGSAALTMDRVAQLAGVSKVTLYDRHKNRQQLLQTVIEGDAFLANQVLDCPPESARQFKERLIAFIETLLAYICSARHLRLMQAIGDLPQKPADLIQIYRNGPDRSLQALAEYLRIGSQRGFFSGSLDAEQHAELLIAAAIGFDMIRTQYRVPLSRRNAAARKSHARYVVMLFLAIPLHKSLGSNFADANSVTLKIDGETQWP